MCDKKLSSDDQVNYTKREAGDTGGISKNCPGVMPALSHTACTKAHGLLAQSIMSIPSVKQWLSEPASGPRGPFRVTRDWLQQELRVHSRHNRAGGLEGGVTNGEEVRVRGHLKPLSTLRRALRSVDIDTKEEELAAFERSDITAVPAAGVIGEAMVALILAGAMREKFGGDSLGEMKETARLSRSCAAIKESPIESYAMQARWQQCIVVVN